MHHIFLNGSRVVSKNSRKRENVYLLENGVEITFKDIKKIEAECPDCKKLRFVKTLSWYLINKIPRCCHCNSLGNRNPFYGKKHTQETKDKIGSKNKGNISPFYGKKHTKESLRKLSESLKGKFKGEKNPFYGKKHPQCILDRIAEKNRVYQASLTKEEKVVRSKLFSNSQKKLFRKDPEKYKALRSKAGKVAATKHEKYKINKLEKIVKDELIKRGLNDFEYSVILDYKQYDFGCKSKRILLEVQGDYWHGNPKIYKEFNDMQMKNKNKDKTKIEFAEKHNFKLFHIWEKDVKEGNLRVLDSLQEYYNAI
jgi:very-short-patch-repair endonuclease